MSHPDTIVAAATPPGRGGVGVVRVSGPKTPEIAATLVGELPVARHATLARFLDARGDPIDIGIALFFPGPQSYTGEHVLELQGHGGPVIVEAAGRARAWSSVRAARARANSPSARFTTTRSISRRPRPSPISSTPARAKQRAPPCARCRASSPSMVQGLTDALIDLRTYVEAAIDFPEEEVDFLADTELAERLATVRGHFDARRRPRPGRAACCATA